MKRFKNILVVANPEGFADALLSRAQWLAQANGAALTLIDVAKTSEVEIARLLETLKPTDAKDVSASLAAVRKEQLETAATALRAEGASVDVFLAQGPGFIEIIQHVIAHDNDLVLKAAEPSPTWRVLGGLDLHLLRKCPCPVWILNSVAEPSSRRIVAAVDPDPNRDAGGALNQEVMELASALAKQDQARLDVLNAWYLYEEQLLRSSRAKRPPEEIELLLEKTRKESNERLTNLTDQFEGISDDMTVLHVKGVPADVIAQHIEDERIDTLVMGAIGRSGMPDEFTGTTADTVLSRVSCSVLAVKPKGFVPTVSGDGRDAR